MLKEQLEPGMLLLAKWRKNVTPIIITNEANQITLYRAASNLSRKHFYNEGNPVIAVSVVDRAPPENDVSHGAVYVLHPDFMGWSSTSNWHPWIMPDGKKIL